MCSPSSQFFDSYLSKNLLFDSTNGIKKANTGKNQHLNQSADPKPNTVPFVRGFYDRRDQPGHGKSKSSKRDFFVMLSDMNGIGKQHDQRHIRDHCSNVVEDRTLFFCYWHIRL